MLRGYHGLARPDEYNVAAGGFCVGCVGTTAMVLESLNELRKRIIICLFSDDELMEYLVLKGGNAVDLVFGIAQRASLDLDFSIPGDFPSGVGEMEQLFRELLERGLGEVGYKVIDVRLKKKPPFEGARELEFWGGYGLEFKVISEELFEKHQGDKQRLRLAAEPVGPSQKKTFKVDFSKHEFCEGKVRRNIEGYTIFVYTPAMIVCE